MPSVARFLAKMISVLSDAASARTPSIWSTFEDVISAFCQISGVVAHDWAACHLSTVTDDNQIGKSQFSRYISLVFDPLPAEDSRVAATSIWSCLKTLLFVTIMVSQPVLIASIRRVSSAPSIAPSFLITLWHLAFVTSKFGGISAHATGFEELKKTCYLALDIIASSPIESEALLLKTQPSTVAEYHPMALAKASTFFIYAEQLAGVISQDTLESTVLPACLKYVISRRLSLCTHVILSGTWTTQNIVKHLKPLIPSS